MQNSSGINFVGRETKLLVRTGTYFGVNEIANIFNNLIKIVMKIFYSGSYFKTFY